MGSVGSRVLIIVQNLPVPFDRRVWLEATSLASNGYEVSVISPKMKGFVQSRETIEDVDVYRYPMPIDPSTRLGFFVEFLWAWLATAVLSMRVSVTGRGFDVIHACNPPETYWVLGRLWRIFGKRFIFDHHDLSPEMFSAKFSGSETGILNRILLFMERWTFRTADAVLATNESHRRLAVERGGVDPDRVFVVRSGPDLARFTRYEPDPKWAQNKKHMIVYLGDISPQDGVDGLVRTVKSLAESRDDFHAVVVGGGSAWNDVRSYAHQLSVEHLMTFTGVVSDDTLCRILSSATLAVDPIRKSPWSDQSTMNKIVEYMYFGLPIVAHDLTETKASANGAVLVAREETDAAFSAAIDELLDDDERRQQMSREGSQRLVEKLAWEHSVPPLLAAYRTVLPGAGGVAGVEHAD